MEVENTGYSVEIKVPFQSNRDAEIAYNVLRIDSEPKRSAVTKLIDLKESNLLVKFSANQAKHIRVGVNAFFESLILCTETIERFGPPAPAYDHY